MKYKFLGFLSENGAAFSRGNRIHFVNDCSAIIFNKKTGEYTELIDTPIEVGETYDVLEIENNEYFHISKSDLNKISRNIK